MKKYIQHYIKNIKTFFYTLVGNNKTFIEPMTLCIATKENNKIRFLSDSRLTFTDSMGNKKYSDIGIKVIKSKVIRTNSNNERIENNIGLCFAGHSNAIYTIKDSIVETLGNLQYAEGLTDLTFESIIKVIQYTFKQCAQSLIDVLSKEGRFEVIVGGFCFVKRDFLVYRLYIPLPVDFDDIKVKYEEILKEESKFFVGSGSDKAKQVYDENKKLCGYDILKAVIESEEIKSVGGDIQIGEFNQTEFTIKGVAQFDSKNQITKFKLRGLDMYNDEWEPAEYHIGLPFVVFKK